MAENDAKAPARGMSAANTGVVAGASDVLAEGSRGLTRGVAAERGTTASRGAEAMASRTGDDRALDARAAFAVREALHTDNDPALRVAAATERLAGAATESPLPNAARGGEAQLGVQAASAASSLPASAATAPAGEVSGEADPIMDLRLARAPDDPEFAGEMTARMKMLVRDGVREARIQLHPAELGRLQVTVNMDGDQARVAFVAESNAARDAIEQSLPRLRELFEQAGLQLAQSDVGQQGQADSRDPAERLSPGAVLADAGDAESASADSDNPRSGPDGPRARIDTYI
jgi:flagellar hook-length control protein FliK